jgi:hypothetical protein
LSFERVEQIRKDGCSRAAAARLGKAAAINDASSDLH